MKAIRIVALIVGGAFVLYQLVIVFIPEAIIVGFHFRWPWGK
jgi:hypothetical protein